MLGDLEVLKVLDRIARLLQEIAENTRRAAEDRK